MNHPFGQLAYALMTRSVRYVLIGVSGANLYAPSGGTRFVTQDFDLFLPPEADALVSAWAACQEIGLDLWVANDPLDTPRDRRLAECVVERRALTRVTGPDDLQVDLTLVMKGYEFVVKSKDAAGRDKDRLFLATHRDALEQLLKSRDSD